jgi:fructosamine-3-kinase
MPAIHWKHRTGADSARFLATEAAGLEWLRVPGGPHVPEIVEVSPSRLGMERVAEGLATRESAHEFGRRLAVLHSSRAPSYGCPPPGAPGPDGWIGDLPMSYTARDAFVEFWALDRLAATARMARDRGGLDTAQVAEVDRFVADLLAGDIDAGTPTPPARLHGDLWNGNVLWGADEHVWLIDPAAHGGHPESDLAMLALFGVPHLDQIISGYQEVQPLAPGWQARIPLHQAWPLLVHAALFGGGYGDSAITALRRARR